MSPRYLGCKVVIVKSFARIHETNLKKQGILPLTFAKTSDYDLFEQADRVSVRGLAALAPGKPVEVVIHKPDGKTVTVAVSADDDRRADRVVQGGLSLERPHITLSSGDAPMAAARVKIPAGEKITISHGKLQVPGQPDRRVHRGRRHRARHLGRVGPRAGRGGGPVLQGAPQDRVGRGLRGREGGDGVREGLPAEPAAPRDPRRHPPVPGGHQGAAHHAGGRGVPLAERDASARSWTSTSASARCAGSRACPRR